MENEIKKEETKSVTDFSSLKESVDKLTAKIELSSSEPAEQPSKGFVGYLKERDPYVFSLLVAVISVFIWFLVLIKEPVHAGISDYTSNLHKIPLLEPRISSMEQDLSEIKAEQRGQRSDVRDLKNDVKSLIKKFDSKYGR